MKDFWIEHRTLVQYTLVDVLFAASTFIGMWAGVLSLAPVAMGALGGYATAWLQTEYSDMSPWVIVPIVAVACALVSLALSFILGRVAGIYFALATLALVLIARVLVINVKSVTGGTTGHAVRNDVNIVSVTVAVLLALGLLAWLRGSRLGLSLAAVRADPRAAASLGVSVPAARRRAFVISGVVGGVAGFFLANFLQYIDSNTFYVDLAFVAVAAVVLGGEEHWLGPFVGAFVLSLLPELLEPWLGRGRDIANGVLLIVIMIYMRRGIVPSLLAARREASSKSRPLAAQLT